MPQMGESVAEGTIVRWLKKVGDAVERDEPLFEISTDKVDAEIPSPAAGVFSDVKVKEGETVPINTVVAVIDETAAKPAAAPANPRSAPSATAETTAGKPAADVRNLPKPRRSLQSSCEGSRTSFLTARRWRYFRAWRARRIHLRAGASVDKPAPAQGATADKPASAHGATRTSPLHPPPRRRAPLRRASPPHPLHPAWRSPGRQRKRASCACRRSCERLPTSITSTCGTSLAAARAAA